MRVRRNLNFGKRGAVYLVGLAKFISEALDPMAGFVAASSHRGVGSSAG